MNIAFIASIAIFITGFVGLLWHKSLVRKVIDIEIMTLSGVLLLLGNENASKEFVTILIIITASEISLAILFIVNESIKKT